MECGLDAERAEHVLRAEAVEVQDDASNVLPLPGFAVRWFDAIVPWKGLKSGVRR